MNTPLAPAAVAEAPVHLASTEDQHIMTATFEFWGLFAQEFPEVLSGDSQLSGEDEAAMAQWLLGDAGDRPSMIPALHTLSLPASFDTSRIDRMVARGIAAAAAYWGKAGGITVASPSADVLQQLALCVRHVLHWNLPDPEN